MYVREPVRFRSPVSLLTSPSCEVFAGKLEFEFAAVFAERDGDGLAPLAHAAHQRIVGKGCMRWIENVLHHVDQRVSASVGIIFLNVRPTLPVGV